MFCLIVSPAAANNLRVANVGLQSQDAGARTAKVVLDLAWDNSWRGGENWDAAWVFVKFRAPGSNAWVHAKLSATNVDHSAPGATIDVGSDGANGLGVFIYRAAAYTGNVNYGQTKLQWNYGSNGYDFAKGDRVEVSVYAIEMVYIPTGSFYLGSGGSEVGHFYQYTDGSQTTNPFPVSSETNAIAVGTTNENLYYPSGGVAGDRLGPISNAFPKGYAAFYCMKYELSQGQWVDFLNKLTAAQDATRYQNKYGIYRYTIWGTMTNRVAVRPDRVCNYLTWADGIAYADWAALRPMTELEFEKACRGPAYPVPNEYAWGTATIMPNASRTLSGAEDGTETVTNSIVDGGCNYGNKVNIGGDGGFGTLRAGIFATNNAPRIPSGAGYYGVMELTGSVWERVVTVGHAVGRGFQGTHGDGVLDANGDATGNADWPVTVGVGYRGGGSYYAAPFNCVSDRYFAASQSLTTAYYPGWRAVRTAP